MSEQLEVVTSAGSWAITSDGVQWMLSRNYSAKRRPYYAPVAFVRSDLAILRRCMRERGINTTVAEKLCRGLPPTFDLWKKGRGGPELTPGAPDLAKGISMPPPDKPLHQARKRPPLRRRP